jgi:tetratricopeptide (TPR) repeat protein
MRLLLVFLLLFTSLSHAAEDAFRHALTAYKAGEFQTALDAFKKIAEDEKVISAALCHNIANCEYKLGQAADGEKADQHKAAETHFGRASIWYRRALVLDPWLPEARQNLRFLAGKLGFHEFYPVGFWETFAQWFRRSHWRAAVIICLWASVISVTWLAWATPRPGRRWPLVSLLSLSLFLGITFGIGLWLRMTERAPFAKRLVNTAAGLPEPVARSAPSEIATSVMPLKPGSELLPIREEGFWTYVEIPGGDADRPTRGWVRTSTTEKLWPWAPSLIE